MKMETTMTIIVADTTCGLPHDLLEKRGIPFIPQIVMFIVSTSRKRAIDIL